MHLRRIDRRNKKDEKESSIPIRRMKMSPMKKAYKLNFVFLKRRIATFILCSTLFSDIICASSTGNANFIERKLSSNLFSDSRTNESDYIRGGSISTSDASRQSREKGTELRRVQKKPQIKTPTNGKDVVFDEKINKHEKKDDVIFTTKRDGSLEVVDRTKVRTNLELFPFIFLEYLHEIRESSYVELDYPESCQIFTTINPCVV